jgi:hypothetical protein
MIVYILFLSPYFFYAVYEVACKPKYKNNYMFTFLIIFAIFFIGMRYKTGADWRGYIEMFERSLKIDWNYSSSENGIMIEYGYILLNKMIKYLFNNYYVLQFMITCFVFIIARKFILHYSEFPFCSLFLFLIFFFDGLLMAQVRQSIAVVIIIISTKYIIQRKLFIFLILVFLASLFHISAICAFPLYFLTIKINKVFLFGLVIFSSIFYFRQDLLFSIIKLFIPYMPNRLSSIASIYLMNNNWNKLGQFNTGIYFLVKHLLLLSWVILAKINNNKEKLFYNAAVVGIIISMISTGMVIIDRLTDYYEIYAIFSYTTLFKDVNFKHMRELILVYSFSILLLFSYPLVNRFITTKKDDLTGRPSNYKYIPYYNVIYFPAEAQYRKDWDE